MEMLLMFILISAEIFLWGCWWSAYLGPSQNPSPGDPSSHQDLKKPQHSKGNYFLWLFSFCSCFPLLSMSCCMIRGLTFSAASRTDGIAAHGICRHADPLNYQTLFTMNCAAYTTGCTLLIFMQHDCSQLMLTGPCGIKLMLSHARAV